MAAHAPQSAANGSIALGQQRIAVSDQQSIQDMEIEQQVGERRKRRLASAAHVAANTIFHSTVGRGRPLVIVGDGGKTAVGSSGTTPAARIESHFSMSIELMEKWTSQVSFISMQKKKKKTAAAKQKKVFPLSHVTNLELLWPRSPTRHCTPQRLYGECGREGQRKADNKSSTWAIACVSQLPSVEWPLDDGSGHQCRHFNCSIGCSSVVCVGRRSRHCARTTGTIFLRKIQGLCFFSTCVLALTH